MDERFIDRDDKWQCLARLVEEAGEVISAAGKIQRFGFHSFNPDLPVEEQVLNKDWLACEIADLESAIEDMKNQLDIL